MTDKDKKRAICDGWMDAMDVLLDGVAKWSAESSDAMGLPVTNELREQTGVWNLPSAGWEYTHTDGHKIVAVWVAESGPWKGVAASWLGVWMRRDEIYVDHVADAVKQGKLYVEIPAKLTGTDKPFRAYVGTYLVRRQDGTFTSLTSIRSLGYTRTRSWGESGTAPTLKVTIEHGDVVRVVENPEYVEYRQVDESGVGVHERTTADGYTTTTCIVPEKPEPTEPRWMCFEHGYKISQDVTVWFAHFCDSGGVETTRSGFGKHAFTVGERYDL